MSREEVIEVQSEVVPIEVVPDDEAELLPGPASEGAVQSWRGEVRNAALAAASGIVVGAAAVAIAKAAGVAFQHRLSQPRVPRRLEPPRGAIASRTYIVDVHLLAPHRPNGR